MHDLTDNKDTREGWEFKLTHEGKTLTYFMRYPTTKEALEAAKLGDENDKALDMMLGFSHPVTEGAPPLKEVVEGKSVKWLKLFMTMIESEWGEA